ncbi:hypothetical protein [Chryseolinea lacunae]|uniref:PH domain-containing protein n=1 Tax=Chryseolinea lacunae TaxID=2801331 RepID=A0ABS1KME0_9BACT|nr:hypothetical protein [Chryseolinea lacunae]MBL0740635.1 hypothetical protein [Chryseolinea lacunae]
MTKSFRYKPPFFFIFLGLGFLFVSFPMLILAGNAEVGLSMLAGFLGLSGLALGIFFTLKFITNFGGDLRIHDDFIEIPLRGRKYATINFRDIKKITKIDTFDNVIELSSKSGLHVIEGHWMKKNDFQELKAILLKSIK